METQLYFKKDHVLHQIWVAAHSDRHLTKNNIVQHKIQESAEQVRDYSGTVAIQIGGNMMLGLIKIFARKVAYILAEAENILIAMSSGQKEDEFVKPRSRRKQTEAPERQRRATIATPAEIDLPEVEPLPAVEIPNQLEPSETFLDDIRESIGAASVQEDPGLGDDPGFGDPGFGDVADYGVLTPANLNVEENAEIRLTSTIKRKPVNKWVADDNTEITNYAAKAADTREIIKPVQLYAPNLLPIMPSKELQFGVFDKLLVPELSEFYKSHLPILNLKSAVVEQNYFGSQLPRPSTISEVEPINFDIGYSDFDVFPDAGQQEDAEDAGLGLQTIAEAETSQEPDYNQGFGVLSRRSKQLLEHLQKRHDSSPTIHFEDVVKEDDRHISSIAFYEMLVLAQKDAVLLTQQDLGEFDGISIEPAQHFYNY